MSNSIDQRALIQAAEQMLEICGAGYRDQLQREYWERVNELPHEVRNAERCRDPMFWVQLNWDAELLATLTDAPAHQCKAALREAMGDLVKRGIGLNLLRELHGQVKRLEQQTARTRFTTRRAG